MNHQMFSFRFRLPPKFEAKIQSHEVKSEHGEPLLVSQDQYAIHVRSVNRFRTTEDAQRVLTKVLQGMNMLGVFLGCGMGDFRSFAGDEDCPGPIENLQAVIVLDEGDLNFERAIQMLNRVGEIPQKYQNAAKLFDDSQLVEDSSVALVLRTIGMEILSPPQPASDDVLEAIEKLATHVRQSAMDSTIVDRLSNALGRLKIQSIAEAVRQHIRFVVPEAPEGVIRRIYETRSKIVHGQSVERRRVSEDSINANTLLRQSLLREIGFKMPDAKFLSRADS